MSRPTLLVAALGAALAAPSALACPAERACAPAVVVWPAYTVSGRWVGAVEAPVQRRPRLELGRITGQPLTVIYENPSRHPGAIDPYLTLVRLPHGGRSDTQGGYPVGY